MITVLLGSGPKASRNSFIVHKSLLMSVSGFFASGLKHAFRESINGMFEMEEEDPTSFAVFVQWVYFNRLFIASVTETSSSQNDDEDEWHCLPRLYTLGERLDAPKFKDAVISAILEKVDESKVVPDNWATYVYQNTVSACSLRRLLVDFHVFAHQGKLLKKGACPDTETPEFDFLQDAMTRMSDLGAQVFVCDEMPWVHPCFYHEHGNVPCHLLEVEGLCSPTIKKPRLRNPLEDAIALQLCTPHNARGMNQCFVVDEPCPLGVQLPLDASDTKHFWNPYPFATLFDWTSTREVSLLNDWRRALIKHNIIRISKAS
jgi:hypothetical protein